VLQVNTNVAKLIRLQVRHSVVTTRVFSMYRSVRTDRHILYIQLRFSIIYQNLCLFCARNESALRRP